MDEIRMGVLGLGFMGTMHARILSRTPGIRVVAVADSAAEKREPIARELAAESYDDFNAFLDSDDIDAVSICLPDYLHRAPAVKAAENGKHILLEKPIATTIEDAVAIAQAVKTSDVVAMIGFLLRYEPHYASVKESLDSGGIGDVIHMYTRRNSPCNHGPRRYGSQGNLTYHVAVHDLDLLLWYSRAPVERVYAERCRRLLDDIGVDDSIVAVIRFADGSIACAEYSWALPETSPSAIDAKLEIVGTKSAVYVDLASQGLTMVTPTGTEHCDITHWPDVFGSIGGALEAEVTSFARCVRGQERPRAGVSEGVAALRVATAIEKSISESRVVYMDEIYGAEAW